MPLFKKKKVKQPVVPVLMFNGRVAIDDVLERDTSRTFGSSMPSNNVFQPPDPDHRSLPSEYRPPQSTSFNHSRSTSTSSSGSSGGNSRKPPPAPPQRRSSKLTISAHEEPHQPPVLPLSNFSVQPQPIVPKSTPATFSHHNHVAANKPVYQRTNSTKSTPPTVASKPMSGIAAAVAAAAQHRKTRINSVDSSDSVQTNSSCPSPVVPSMPIVSNVPVVSSVPVVMSKPPAPAFTQSTRNHYAPPIKTEPKQTSSALMIALAAKRASMKNSQTNNQPTVTPYTQPTNSEKFSLPPPPPTPPGEKAFDLPPPPSGSGDPLRLDGLFLPPPPDSLLMDDSFPPPCDFASENKGFGDLPILPPVKYKDELPTTNSKPADDLRGDFLPKQSTDSGVTSLNSNMETMSLGSTLSTMSSEDGSDVGVSFSCHSKPNGEFPGTASEILKKINSQNSTTINPVALTKVQFGGKPSKSDNIAAHRRDVTQPPVAEKPQDSSEGKPSLPRKSLKSWTSGDVTQWLNAIGLGMHAQVFAENEIVGSHLPELDKDDLSELGVTRVGHRITIEKSLKSLK